MPGHLQGLPFAPPLRTLARAIMRSNECAEEVYRRLMLAYQRLDRRGDAILAYQRCRKNLSAVLGIAPSAETEALHRSLQRPDC